MLLPKEIKISKENFLLMQPILVLSRICGLCPIYYKDCGLFYKLQWSVLYGIYGYILISALALTTVLNLLNDSDEGKRTTDKTDQKAIYVTTIEEISATTVLIFCVLAIPCKIKSLWKIFHYFAEIEKTFSVKQALDYRKKSIYFTSFVLGIYSAVYLFDIIIWHTQLESIDNYKAFLLEYVPYYVLKYVVLAQILFFCHLVYFVKIKISCLNQLLLSVNTSVRLSVSSHEIHFSKVLRIFELANSQKKLYETVDIINNTTAFGVVVLMLSFLLHLTSSSFFLLTEIERHGNSYFVWLQLVWLIAHAGKLLMIIESCQHCVRESEKTTYIVYNLLTNDFGTINDALNVFAIQLSKCKIKFNICGLFNIDRSIFTSFVAAITTYLVVLLQLNN